MNRTVLAVGAVLAVLVILGVLAGRDDASPSPPNPPLPTSAEPRPRVGDAAPRAVPWAGTDTAPAQRAGAALTPRELARTFAAQQANWSWKTIARQYRRLAGLATGPLAAELHKAAHDARLDATLQRDRAGSRGHVLGIAVKGAGARRRIVVATLEHPYRSAATDLTGQRARVYIGQAEHRYDGWVMAEWEPQP